MTAKRFSCLLLLLACLAGPAAAPPARLNLSHETSFVVFPADANAMGTLFGGKLLAEMDRAAAVTVRRLLYASPATDAVTAAVEGVRFHRGGAVKDLVFVRGEVVGLGGRSVRVRVVAERETRAGRELLADGVFVFAAYDLAARKAVPHGLTMPRVP